jgi:hypothetical protein
MFYSIKFKSKPLQEFFFNFVLGEKMQGIWPWFWRCRKSRQRN